VDELDDEMPVSLPYATAGGSDLQISRAHEQYSVYVNNLFVGHKTLLKQVESIDDVVRSYLARNVDKGFQISTDGNHCKITAQDLQSEHEIRTQLSVYLDTHSTGTTGDQPGF
jgi:hypothetical protein